MNKTLLTLLLLAPVVASAARATPLYLSNQGRLLEANDAPATGSHALTFSLYTLEAPPPGGSSDQDTVVWTETVDVELFQGVYSVVLGSKTAFEAAMFEGERFIGVAVDGGSELLPRLRVPASPYAMNALQARRALVAGALDASCVGCVKGAMLEGGAALSNLADGTITATKLAEGAALTNLGEESISATMLAAGAALSNLADGSIPATKLVEGAALSNLADGSIPATKLAEGAALSNLANGSLPLAKVAGYDAQKRQIAGLDAATLGGLAASEYAKASDLSAGNGIAQGTIDSAPACSAAKVGGIFYATDKGAFYGCAGSPPRYFRLGMSLDGAAKIAAGASCKAIRDAGVGAGDGAYWIDPTGGDTADAFPVYCDMTTDGGGWTMVFKLTGGVAGAPNTLWAGAVMNENDTTFLNVARSSSHYMNRIVTTHWNVAAFTFSEARTHVYKNGSLAKFLKFNAAGSTKANWFDKSRYLSSSWSDLSASAATNYWSIDGDTGNLRHFFVNQAYGGCAADTGWLDIGGAATACSWETTRGNPLRIIYSDAATAQNWTAGTIALGDVFAVFVR